MNSNQIIMIRILLLLSLTQLAASSGVFEINLSSLIDAQTGRDLREDCCSWQNSSQQVPLTTHHSMNIHANHLLNQQQQQQNQQQCDPNKCQLIVRICVKNYQTQIDPNQCTFGELSGQVLKPTESQLNQYNQQQQQQQLFKAKPTSQVARQSANIHYQRMLFQQQFKQQSPVYQQLSSNKNPLLGQPRAMRTIAFNQPISFPFNFTWPVS